MFYVGDFGDGTFYETEEEAMDFIREYVATYGDDIFNDEVECRIPWSSLFDWASQQPGFWDKFGDAYEEAFQAFAEMYICEMEDEDYDEYIKVRDMTAEEYQKYLHEQEHAPSYLAGWGRK